MKTRKPTKEQRRQGYYSLTRDNMQSLVKWGARLHIKESSGMMPIFVLPTK